MFITEYDERDLKEDLQRRTQARGEKIMDYLISIKYLVSRFKKRPSRKEICETVYRNLLPDYRRSMADRIVTSLEDIEE